MWCICEWRSSSDNYCGVMEWLDLSHWSLWIPLCLKVEVFCFPCKQLWIRSCHWKIRVLSKCLSSFRITQDKHYGVASPSWSVAQMVKHLSAMQETCVRSLGGEILWRRKWQPSPVFFLGKSHGRWSLVGYCPWGRKELDMTERLHFHFHYLN